MRRKNNTEKIQGEKLLKWLCRLPEQTQIQGILSMDRISFLLPPSMWWWNISSKWKHLLHSEDTHSNVNVNMSIGQNLWVENDSTYPRHTHTQTIVEASKWHFQYEKRVAPFLTFDSSVNTLTQMHSSIQILCVCCFAWALPSSTHFLTRIQSLCLSFLSLPYLTLWNKQTPLTQKRTTNRAWREKTNQKTTKNKIDMKSSNLRL